MCIVPPAIARFTPFEWSLQLLAEWERDIFARLSVFHGGWTLEDANAVLADVEPDVLLESLQSLRDASLITSEQNDGGELRFSMLEMVREIANERLDEEQRLSTRRSHAEFYFQLAQRAAKDAKEYGRRAVWGTTEGSNFSAALDFWAVEDIECALEMASFLWWYWIFSYHLPEGRHYFRELLAKPQVNDFPVARARAQGCAAYIALLSGYHARRTSCYARHLACGSMTITRENERRHLIYWEQRQWHAARRKKRGIFMHAAWNCIGGLACPMR